MWKFALCFALLTGPVFANGLIEVPPSAIVRPTTPANPAVPGQRPLGLILSGGADNSSDLPSRLDGAPEAEYKHYFNTLFLYQKQSVMASKARTIPAIPAQGVRCLEHKDAFGFQKMAETDYKLNCLAGSGRRISHLANYRMTLEYFPAGCASEAAVNAHFSVAANRNRRAAADFYNNWKKTCIIQAYPASLGTPVVSVDGLTQDFVRQRLEQNAELDKFVNGSRINVPSGSDSGSEKEPPVAPRPKPRPPRPAREDDDAPPARTRIPCVAGSAFCNSSDAN